MYMHNIANIVSITFDKLLIKELLPHVLRGHNSNIFMSCLIVSTMCALQ